MNISKTAAKMIETTRNAMVKGQNGNLQNTLADPQIKLWTAEEIAKYLGMSLSFVYAHISKEKPQVMLRDGRICYYSQEWVETLKSKPLHPRIMKAKVKRIPRKEAVEQFATEQPNHGSLFWRLETTEKELVALKSAYEDLLKKLGI